MPELRDYRYQYYRVQDLRAQLDNSIRAFTYDGMPKSQGYSDISADIVRRDMIEKELREATAELDRLRVELTGLIDTVQDRTAGRVLYLHYIGLMNFKEIADYMGYSLSRIYNLHSIGLREISGINSKEQ